MNLQERKALLVQLGNFIRTDDAEWEAIKDRAFRENGWFLPEFISLSVKNIAQNFLTEPALEKMCSRYPIPEETSPKKIGLVLAGNIPLVGFHDVLCVFLAGHFAFLKPSSKDQALLRFLITKMIQFNEAAAPYFTFGEMLKSCDAYIATGSNNTSAYFDYYFAKYPHIIRRNRTSVAVLIGDETDGELEALADDVYLYYGLGCRNVTKIYVPVGYAFERLLQVFRKYNYLADNQKYKNNYDYNLTLHLMNKRFYMSNESLILVEDPSPFSPIGQLNYEFYKNLADVQNVLANNDSIQCVVSKLATPFGKAQQPEVCEYADGVDTMQFLVDL